MTEAVQHPTVFDAGRQQVGGVYAKALLGAAEKAGATALVLEELDSFVGDVLERMPQFEATLASPNVPLEAKLRLLDRGFAGKMSLTLLNFLKVTARHRRLDCIRAIHRAAHELHNEMTGRLDAYVCTAQPLTDELRQQVTARLEAQLGRQVHLRTTIDENLIGGMVVRVGDTVYDGSVAQQLRRLREDTLERTAAALQRALERFESQ